MQGAPLRVPSATGPECAHHMYGHGYRLGTLHVLLRRTGLSEETRYPFPPYHLSFDDAFLTLYVGFEVGDVVLYFGCRSKHEDYIYEKELNQYKEDKVLTSLNVACSRDQENKVYVQHLMLQQTVPLSV